MSYRFGFIIFTLFVLSNAAYGQWVAEPCKFSFASERRADCGYMHVAENRAIKQSKKIAFPVIILRNPKGTTAADPVVILGGGGPGIGLGLDEPQVEQWWAYYDWIFDSGRDLILLDPRGVGLSRPALTCPEATEQVAMLWGSRLTVDLENRLIVEAYNRCYDRHRREGIAVEHYNTMSTARDVEELRRALKIKQWNLYGTSYAGTLAMVVMREYPKGVRSVILDSVQPPGTLFFKNYAERVSQTFETLFAVCAADAQCKRDFPALKQTLANVVERLDRKPAVVNIAHPLTLEPFPIVVNGVTFLALLRSAMYNETKWAELPMLIYSVDRGSVDLLAPYARHSFQDELDPTYSDGVHLSVSCREEVPHNAMERALDEAKRHPIFSDTIRSVVSYYQESCRVWKVPAAPMHEAAPVTVDIPTLIFGGSWDPVTPAVWGHAAAQSLENANMFEFPATGHDVMSADYCGVILASQFLRDPKVKPQSDCMDTSHDIEFDTLPQFGQKPR